MMMLMMMKISEDQAIVLHYSMRGEDDWYTLIMTMMFLLTVFNEDADDNFSKLRRLCFTSRAASGFPWREGLWTSLSRAHKVCFMIIMMVIMMLSGAHRYDLSVHWFLAQPKLSCLNLNVKALRIQCFLVIYGKALHALEHENSNINFSEIPKYCIWNSL